MYAFDTKNIKIIDAKGFSMYVSTDLVVKLEADRNYTIIYLKDNKRYVASRTLQHFEEMLGNSFVRINRQSLVNVGWVSAMQESNGLLEVWLRTGECTVASRRRRKNVFDFLMEIKFAAA